MEYFRNRKQIKIIISWIAILLCMVLNFNLSSRVRDKSNNLSKGVTEIVIKTVEEVAPEADFDLDRFKHIIRNNVHFFAYLIFGILVLNAMRRSGVLGLKGILITLSICVLYATSDEIIKPLFQDEVYRLWMCLLILLMLLWGLGCI